MTVTSNDTSLGAAPIIFANADTVIVDLDFRSDTKSDMIAVSFAGRNQVYGPEAQFRVGYYSIRRSCEYVKIRPVPPLSKQIVGVTMVSRVDAG